MKLSNLFPSKKNKETETLPEVTISGPKRALERLEGNSNILERREQILANANTDSLNNQPTPGTIMNMNSQQQKGTKSINYEPLESSHSKKPQLNILEGKEHYKREGLRLEDNEYPLHPIKEETFVPNNRSESIDLLVNSASPNTHHEPVDYYDDDEMIENDELYHDGEVEDDPFDESSLETGYTEVVVILIDGNLKNYLFNISKTKFEQQWLDEIHSIGIFTAKDIYGNMVTLSPLDKGASVAFEIKEGNLPGIL